MELWLPVPGFTGYEVSDTGLVRSYLPAGFGPPPDPPRILCANEDGDGYRRVYLRRDGRTHSKKIAWLVLEAFKGPRPKGMDSCHDNGNRQDDNLSNLRWDTRKKNLADREKHGTMNRGKRNGKATLGEDDIREIRRRAASGESQGSIAKCFGLQQSTVSKIKRRERWGWIND